MRVDATVVPGGVAFLSPVYAFVSTGSSTSILVSNPPMATTLVIVSQGLMTSASAAATRPFLQCESYAQHGPVGSVTFTENFVTAFKLQGATASTTSDAGSPPPAKYAGHLCTTQRADWRLQSRADESGVADSPTELQTTISNIPTGVVMYRWTAGRCPPGCCRLHSRSARARLHRLSRMPP